MFKRKTPWIIAAMALLLSGAVGAQGQASPPFRFYSGDDGLSTRNGLDLDQDQHGIVWVATWSGLNRYDGNRFSTLTTRHGLLDNSATAVYVDRSNRIWVGHSQGGMSLLEDGRVTQTLAPVSNLAAPIFNVVQTSDRIYVASRGHGLLWIDESSGQPMLKSVEGSPEVVWDLVGGGRGRVLLQTEEGLVLYTPGDTPSFEQLHDDITTVAGDETSAFFGTGDGRMGQWIDDQVVWHAAKFDSDILAIAVAGGSARWVSTPDHLISLDGKQSTIEAPAPTEMMIDREGVLWLITTLGPARYLGQQFVHYPMEQMGTQLIVHAVETDNRGRRWFGTATGLQVWDKNDTPLHLAENAVLPDFTVRDLVIDESSQALWAGGVGGPLTRIDLSTLAVTPVEEFEHSALGLAVGPLGRIWAGSDAFVLRYDPVTETLKTIHIGDHDLAYSLAVDQQGFVWFSTESSGIYRINARDETMTPERMISAADLGSGSVLHLLFYEHDGVEKLLAGTASGLLLRAHEGKIDLSVRPPALADNLTYMIQPLADNTVLLGTNRGLFRYNLLTEATEHYGVDQGYLGLETRVHASHLENQSTLWIGTTAGATRMDLSIPMSGARPLTPSLVRATSGAEQGLAAKQQPELNENRLAINYLAVSTAQSGEIEYRYRLAGLDPDWGATVSTTTVTYSSLPAGEFAFHVQARRSGYDWSESTIWPFTVPTPWWAQWWAQALGIAITLLLIFVVIRLRTHQIAAANRRLTQEVAERTRSIEQARTHLQQANDELVSEKLEREKADLLRADVEARFQQAYQNAPIGIALVDNQGVVFSANPVLRQAFWPEAEPEDTEPLINVISEPDRPRFASFLNGYFESESSAKGEEFACITQSGNQRRVIFHPSPVRDRQGEVQYSLLIANDVTETRELTEKLAHQASFDELTGLHNRRSFGHELEALFDQSGDTPTASLMYMDLDQFKVVNDTCGHAAGDDLLVQVSELLQRCLRGQDVVARIGGDEFAALLVGCPPEVAVAKAEAMRAAVEALEFPWNGEVFRIGVSIGVVHVGNSDTSQSELQQIADAACYAAKEAGRNRVHVVSGQADQAQQHRGNMRWVQRLQTAMDHNQFCLYQQNIEPLNPTGEVTRQVEVLLRLRDVSQGKIIPPGAFLPAAARYGLSAKLDEWVVSNLIHALHIFETVSPSGCAYWVNLSGASIGEGSFCEFLCRAIEQSPLPAGMINFEITETEVIRNLGEAAQLIDTLRDKGCRFSLDDFGSGLSSLGYLKKLNVDLLKIDGAFIREISNDETDRIFVKSIIDIAHARGIQTVAKLVEQQETLKTVRSLGADFAQGFAIHRPEVLLPHFPPASERQSRSA